MTTGKERQQIYIHGSEIPRMMIHGHEFHMLKYLWPWNEGLKYLMAMKIYCLNFRAMKMKSWPWNPSLCWIQGHELDVIWGTLCFMAMKYVWNWIILNFMAMKKNSWPWIDFHGHELKKFRGNSGDEAPWKRSFAKIQGVEEKMSKNVPKIAWKLLIFSAFSWPTTRHEN